MDYNLCGSLRQYAFRHGNSWYEWLNGNGADVPNGSLYLITGVDKTKNWCLASYSRLSTPALLDFFTDDVMITPDARVAPTQDPPQQDTAARQYFCRQSGSVPVRTCHLARDDGPPNQCNFIRGFKLAMNRSLFGRCTTSVRVDAILNMNPNELLHKDQSIPGASTSSLSSGPSFIPWLGDPGGDGPAGTNWQTAVSVDKYPEMAQVLPSNSVCLHDH